MENFRTAIQLRIGMKKHLATAKGVATPSCSMSTSLHTFLIPKSVCEGFLLRISFGMRFFSSYHHHHHLASHERSFAMFTPSNSQRNLALLLFKSHEQSKHLISRVLVPLCVLTVRTAQQLGCVSVGKRWKIHSQTRGEAAGAPTWGPAPAGAPCILSRSPSLGNRQSSSDSLPARTELTLTRMRSSTSMLGMALSSSLLEWMNSTS